MTYQEIYSNLLIDLRQYATATLYPNEFNRLWNKEMLNWVQLRAAEDEQSDKRNQDLQKLRVVDDTIVNTGAVSPGKEEFLLPYSPNKVNAPGNPGFKNYGFLRIENISVRGNYTECNTSKVLDWQSMTPWIKGDTKHININPFRVPVVATGISEISYEIRDFKVFIHAGQDFIATKIMLEYLRYPEPVDVEVNPSMVFELPNYVIDEISARVRTEFMARTANPSYPASINQQKTTVN